MLHLVRTMKPIYRLAAVHYQPLSQRAVEMCTAPLRARIYTPPPSRAGTVALSCPARKINEIYHQTLHPNAIYVPVIAYSVVSDNNASLSSVSSKTHSFSQRGLNRRLEALKGSPAQPLMPG